MDPNNYEEILSIKSRPLTLVTINNDCKELIFEHLGVKDLVNIAETSKLHTGGHYDNRYKIFVLLNYLKL